jgi:hypothetical protein
MRKSRNRFVNPYLFPLFKGLRLGVRTVYAVVFSIYMTSAIALLISIFAFGLLFDSLRDSFLLVAVSATLAVTLGMTSTKLHTAAQSLDRVRPLNNDSANLMPAEATLLRGAYDSSPNADSVLLRVPATHSESADELVRSCNRVTAAEVPKSSP